MSPADPVGIRSGSPLATLRRINSTRPTVAPGERCEMCAEPIAEAHQHLVDLESRSLMCACRGCYLLFIDQHATLRYRAVPDRYLSFPDFTFTRADWEDLQIPVGLAFLFRNSVQERFVAFYPSPAGATESELSLESWDKIVAANPQLDELLPDVEALLLSATDRSNDEFSCHLVPIDACYELVGTMRQTWRGFDGGQEARTAMGDFFATVERRSKPAPAVKPLDTP
jgi:Family of unknown function (DUF5947)